MRPIDADEITYMHDCFPSCSGNCMTCERNIVRKDFIDSLDTLDVQEVKHARWYYAELWHDLDNEDFSGVECSNCGGRLSIDSLNDPLDFKFCPYCGAKMDKE